MTLTIELTQAEEARLMQTAELRGIPPEELARQLIADMPVATADTSVVPRGHNVESEVERHGGLDQLAAESQELGLY